MDESDTITAMPEGDNLDVRAPGSGMPGTVPDQRAVDTILQHHAEFQAILSEALRHEKQGDRLSSAVYASMAAQAAAHRHPGYFASPSLERLLVRLGRTLPRTMRYVRPTGTSNPLRKVVHVCSQLVEVGGHTKMLCRWIKADSARQHSVVVTQQRGPVPASVANAIRDSRGTLSRVNQRPGNLLTWASSLRQIAQQADIVILHIGNQDVTPVLAFADPQQRPPVVFLNHSDHMFWIGGSVSDVVMNLREAARTLSADRRFIPAARNLMVPTLVDVTVRRQTQEEARRQIGIPQDATMILSAARGVKYRTLGGRTFADTHAPLLKAHENARLVVVGAGRPKDWEPAIAETDGRIIPVPEQPDPRLYYEAADIYVDSYPFVSSTSMMEAAGYGLPLVTRFEGPEAANITAINHPGLLNAPVHVRNEADYVRELDALVSDRNHRMALGEAAKAEVARFHEPESWRIALDECLLVACNSPAFDGRGIVDQVRPDVPYFGEPDIRLNDIFGEVYSTARMKVGFIGYFGSRQRLREWRSLAALGVFHSRRQMIGAVLPEWAIRALESRIRLY